MKIKNDHVTNSSSVSFVLWGVALYDTEVSKNKNLMKTLYDLLKEYDDQYKDLSFEDFCNWRFDRILNIAYDLLYGNNDLVFTTGQYGDDFIIGKDVKKLKEEQTFADFKKEAEEALKSLGIDKKCSMIERSWYNG